VIFASVTVSPIENITLNPETFADKTFAHRKIREIFALYISNINFR